ncbi:MAG: peptidylprolyl isomerase [Merismopedia sp. SIO2A8]|nr:peptidylprolyl isomerase [Symploca sp. SIO2B6]NET52090.1 peptidylprolyl isomerase [Merismopedia sp. SIO2A8]
MVSVSSDTPASLEDVLYFLKTNMKFKDVCQGILRQNIIQQAAIEHHIDITDEDVQVESDRIRRQKRLESARATLVWLDEQLVTPEDWEQGIRDRLLAQKLASTLFFQEAEKYFAEHRIDFDSVILYQILVPHEKLATELFYQIEEEEISFYQAAHFYDVAEDRRRRCGFEGKLYRRGLSPDISAAVFGASPQRVLRPIKTEQGYHILMVEERIPAKLTPELKQDIINRLFEEWLMRELEHHQG